MLDAAGKRTVVFGRSVEKGSSVIGENCWIGPDVYVGPYTAVKNRCQIPAAEVDDSILMDGSNVRVERKFVRSMIEGNSKIVVSNGLLPKADKIAVWEVTTVLLNSFLLTLYTSLLAVQ